MTSLRAVSLALALALACSCAHDPGSGAGGKADDLGGGRDAAAAIEAWNQALPEAERTAKFCKMAASPFGFYRGSNHLFWSDLGDHDALGRFGGGPASRTFIQGDLHALNVGAFDDDDGELTYDLNDFDEAIIADWQYDVWRMAISIDLVGRAQGLDSGAAIEAFVEDYLDAMHDFAKGDDEAKAPVDERSARPPLDAFLADVDAAQGRKKSLGAWTKVEDGVRRFRERHPELAAVTHAERAALVASMPAYGRTLSGALAFDPAYFSIKDVARRLGAGTGSLGTSRFYLLIEGPGAGTSDDLILDVKQQSKPTAYSFLPAGERTAHDEAFSDPATRHAIAQRALLDDADDHLGWLRLDDAHSFSVRERSVRRAPFPVEELTRGRDLDGLAAQWGVIAAAAHARADRDFDRALVPGSIDAEIDRRTDGRHAAVRAQIRDIASAYADQVETDFAAFSAALAPASCPD